MILQALKDRIVKKYERIKMYFSMLWHSRGIAKQVEADILEKYGGEENEPR